MKLALLLVAASLPAFGAIAKINNAVAQTIGGSGTATIAATDFRNSTLLTGCFGSFNAAISTPTDSLGNTWVRMGTERISGTAHIALYYVANPTVGAAQTVSVVSDYPYLAITGWSGVTTVAPLDQSTGNTVTSSTTIQPGSITPQQINELVMSCVSGTNPTPASWTVNSGMALINTITGAGTHLQDAFIVQTAAAAINPTWTTASGASDMTSVIGSFKATPDYTTSGATSGFVGIASSNLTLTKASGNFTACTLSISDGTHAGVWGGSFTGTGTGTAVANAVSTISGTYNATQAGSFTFTFSNNCGLIDPPSITWTSNNPTVTSTTFPNSGTKASASASFTIALNTGAVFPGAVVLTDSGNGGSFTPSTTGILCVSPCSVAATGLTSFTSTYTAAVIGVMILTTTNGFAYTNATPANDTITFAGALHTAIGNGNFSAAGTWDTGTVPVSGDTWLIPSPYTVHVPAAASVISGACPATRTAADGQINPGAALVLDSGSTFRMQGNIKMTGVSTATTNLPILQLSKGAAYVGDACNKAVVTGPFGANVEGWNAVSVGVDTANVTISSSTLTRNAGADFSVAWVNQTATLKGVAATILSCASVNTCTLSAAPGNASNVLLLVTQPGALTAVPSTTFTGINTALANPAFLSPNASYDNLSMTIYGLTASTCGTSTIACIDYVISDFSNADFLAKLDMANAYFDSTGGVLASGKTYHDGVINRLNNVRITNTLGTTSYDNKSLDGQPTLGGICSVTNSSFDKAVLDGTSDFSGCTATNNAFLGEFKPGGGPVTAANHWVTFTNNIILRDCYSGGEFTFEGNLINNLVDCTTLGASGSAHFAFRPNESTLGWSATGNIFVHDAAGSEGHCLLDYDLTGTVYAIGVSNNLVTRGADGHLACTLIISNSAAAPMGVYTATHNGAFGDATFSAFWWAGEDPGYPSNQTLAAFKSNLFAGATAASSNYMFAYLGSASTGPHNVALGTGVDYNGLFNAKNSTIFSASFNLNCAPDSTSNNTPYSTCNTDTFSRSHDLVVNPRPANPTASPVTWAATMGQAGTVAGLKAAFSTAVPSTYPALIASAMSYIKTGYSPTNFALKNKGHDGATIGPMDIVLYGSVQ